ncbi:MAG TPA: hypothetical protein VGV92_02960 [Gammaproteobacteria bacterium]|nr:hypothetical protein [Gammaproteobacteria bacterium]
MDERTQRHAAKLWKALEDEKPDVFGPLLSGVTDLKLLEKLIYDVIVAIGKARILKGNCREILKLCFLHLKDLTKPTEGLCISKKLMLVCLPELDNLGSKDLYALLMYTGKKNTEVTLFFCIRRRLLGSEALLKYPNFVKVIESIPNGKNYRDDVKTGKEDILSVIDYSPSLTDVQFCLDLLRVNHPSLLDLICVMCIYSVPNLDKITLFLKRMVLSPLVNDDEVRKVVKECLRVLDRHKADFKWVHAKSDPTRHETWLELISSQIKLKNYPALFCQTRENTMSFWRPNEKEVPITPVKKKKNLSVHFKTVDGSKEGPLIVEVITFPSEYRGVVLRKVTPRFT